MACDAPTGVVLAYVEAEKRLRLSWSYEDADNVLGFRIRLLKYNETEQDYKEIKKGKANSKARRYTFKSIGVSAGEKYGGCVAAICKNCEVSAEVCHEIEIGGHS
jgi:hypothetical protein